MRRFVQKTDKEGHEMQCNRRQYEFFLCGKFVTRAVHEPEQFVFVRVRS